MMEVACAHCTLGNNFTQATAVTAEAQALLHWQRVTVQPRREAGKGLTGITAAGSQIQPVAMATATPFHTAAALFTATVTTSVVTAWTIDSWLGLKT